MAAGTVIAIALLVGWFRPGMIIACIFYSFSIGTLLDFPQITAILVTLVVAMLILRHLVYRNVVRVILLDLVFAAYICWCSATCLWSSSPVAAQEVSAFVASIVSTYLAFRLAGSSGPLDRIVSQMQAGFLVLTLVVVPLVFASGLFLNGRIFVNGGPPVALSQPVPYVLICAAALILHAKKQHLAAVFLGLLVSAMAMAMVVATGTRGALITLVAGLCTLLFMSRPSASRLFGVSLAIAFTAATVMLLAETFGVGQNLASRLLAFGRYGNEADLSSAARLESYALAWTMFAQHPLAGAGLGSFEHSYGGLYPHNLFLEVLSETGVIGLALIAIVGVCAAARWRHLSRTYTIGVSSVIGAMLVAGFVHQQFSFELAQAKGLLLIAVLAGARIESAASDDAAANSASGPAGLHSA